MNKFEQTSKIHTKTQESSSPTKLDHSDIPHMSRNRVSKEFPTDNSHHFSKSKNQLTRAPKGEQELKIFNETHQSQPINQSTKKEGVRERMGQTT